MIKERPEGQNKKQKQSKKENKGEKKGEGGRKKEEKGMDKKEKLIVTGCYVYLLAPLSPLSYFL